MTLRISEDSRFVFAGVNKGSVDMLALDIGRLVFIYHTAITTTDITLFIHYYRSITSIPTT
jgi:hypothetical protein